MRWKNRPSNESNLSNKLVFMSACMRKTVMRTLGERAAAGGGAGAWAGAEGVKTALGCRPAW